MLAWHYGSGFPKSLDVSKAIDAAAGAERDVVGSRTVAVDQWTLAGRAAAGSAYNIPITAPATDAAREWSGWGTALKPAWEPIILARRPLAGTVAANVLEHGAGALNVDGCRVETGGETLAVPYSDPANRTGIVGAAMQPAGGVTRQHAAQAESIERTNRLGRWPANTVLVHPPHCDGDRNGRGCVEGCPVGEMGRQSGEGVSTSAVGVRRAGRSGGIMGAVGEIRDGRPEGHDDSGTAARFFYQAKASRAEREAGGGRQFAGCCRHHGAQAGQRRPQKPGKRRRRAAAPQPPPNRQAR